MRGAGNNDFRGSGFKSICKDCYNANQRAKRAVNNETLAATLAAQPDSAPTAPEPYSQVLSAPPVIVLPPEPGGQTRQIRSPLAPQGRSNLTEATAGLVRFGIIPDVHHPNAHPWYRVMLRAMKVFNPTGLVVLGDFADAESLSAHPKTQEGRSDFLEEVDCVNKELDILDALPGLQWKKYIEGNHEYRLQRYLHRNAQALANMVTIQQCFRLHERGWEFTPYMKSCRVGKINITHDTGTAGMNAHRNARDVFMGSVIIGHVHRMSLEVRGVFGKAPVVSACFGWLGDAEAITYVHQALAAAWPLGFGLGYLDPVTQLCFLVPCPIVNGMCMVEGQIVR